jgi:hypothetical protein
VGVVGVFFRFASAAGSLTVGAMKRVFLFLGIVLLCVSVVVGAVVLTYRGKVQAYRQEIQRIEDEHDRALASAQKVKRFPDTLFSPAFSITNLQRGQFLRELRKIDTSQCPQSFRVAWLDYVQAQERLNESESDVIGSFVNLFRLSKGDPTGVMGQYVSGQDSHQELSEARRRLCREALKWGVDY